ncbi:hypothetical protein IWQ62_000321 [Dispira parvispora]|uniref:Extracellular metalloproteinase n=1 Tax=Dispira parvispora TaxID=1520584 RepID=A0A9W8AV14_9FUNG|nr:hypothetical protein IWQ62_000321 [Dispira parvispora]
MKIIGNSLGLLLFALYPVRAVMVHGDEQTVHRSFGPDLDFSQYDTTVQDIGIAEDPDDPVSIAQAFVQTRFGLTPEDYSVHSSYQTNRPQVYHIHLRQKINGLEVTNGDMNINIDAEGRVISFGSSLLIPSDNDQGEETQGDGKRSDKPSEDETSTGTVQQLRRRTPNISPTEALVNLANYMEEPVQNREDITEEVQGNLDGDDPLVILHGVDICNGGEVPVRLAYIITDEGTLAQVYELVIQTDNNWAQGYVDSQTGNTVMFNSYINQAYYNVFPLGTSDPKVDSRQIVTDKDLDPDDWKNWHYRKNTSSSVETRGNNVHAQADPKGYGAWQELARPQVDDQLEFDFPLDLSLTPHNYTNAAITNLFYWNNVMHDLFYRYGFDEAAGNFQDDNFGLGGAENDAVVANGQNGAGFNNADFATPPDGQRPRMRMYLWNTYYPLRDGDLVNDIIIHEYGHGISNRLTGGPANSACLGWGEAGGMGEGWSDFFAVVLKMKESHTGEDSVLMSPYVKANGIRRYPYSSNMTVNPFTYKDLNTMSMIDVHTIGTVWATVLYEVYWALVNKLGYTSDLYSASVTHGNTLALQLVVLGLKLQPCRPTFQSARDAILVAEKLISHGRHHCTLWEAFAKRGLGNDATSLGGRSNGFEVPGECPVNIA